MPAHEAPCVELGAVPQTPSVGPSPSPSEVSEASTPDPQFLRPTPLFRALAMPPPDPEQPPGQDELERRVPGYRRIVIPRDLTLIELLKQCSGVTTDEEVLQIREAKLRVVAERVGLRRLHVLAPCLRSLTLDGSAISSLRDLGIGLVHLKILSVNRCGLSCLDGVWGLGALRELHAAGNRLEDLQPLAALQKLHTLNLADNPISDTGRLWTLGVLTSLRRLTLQGTPASDEPDYRTRVAMSLPMLISLDDRPLHMDVEDEIEGIFGEGSSSSESEDEEPPLPASKAQMEDDSVPGCSQEPMATNSDDDCENQEKKDPGMSLPKINHRRRPATTEGAGVRPLRPTLPRRPKTAQERPSIDAPTRLQILNTLMDDDISNEEKESGVNLPKMNHRRRPATTEGAGVRPLRPTLPRRPKTAQERPSIDAPTRLQILNTLMDEEWRCSGSKLTSAGTVCGNLAQALRRPASARRFATSEAKRFYEKIEETIKDTSSSLAAEIPVVPKLADWEKFKEKTGIDIDIDFNQRTPGDALSAIERLERIEKETSARLSGSSDTFEYRSPMTFGCAVTIMDDFEKWKAEAVNPTKVVGCDVATLFDGIDSVSNDGPLLD